MTDVDGTATIDAVDSDSRWAGERPSETPDDETVVTAHRSAPGRTVFTEAGNTDAWIASSLTVDRTE